MSMMTAVCLEPGRIGIQERALPLRGPGDVLLRIRRIGVCGTDMHIYRGSQPYLSYPRVMGHELAGEVVEAPEDSGLAAGDRVYVMPYLSCGACAACRKGRANACMALQVLGVHRDGGMAEFLTVPAAFVGKADGLSLEAAAMVEFLAIGAHAVRRAGVRAGQSVLVVGAGPIGIAAALFATLRGGCVTALDSRADRLAFCKTVIGVEHVVLAGEDGAARLSRLTDGDFYDVVFDATGSPSAMEAGFGYVAHGGTYVLISIVASEIRFSDPEFHKREMTLMGSRNATPEDFGTVVAAMRAGQVPVEALHTHSAPLDAVARALPAWMEPGAGVIKAILTC